MFKGKKKRTLILHKLFPKTNKEGRCLSEISLNWISKPTKVIQEEETTSQYSYGHRCKNSLILFSAGVQQFIKRII
jgi:hypothetical protein